MRLPEGTISGIHRPVGNIREADCVIMQEFGSDPELETNQAIIDYVLLSETICTLPLFVSGSLAVALQARGARANVVHTFEGPSAEGMQENTGTFGELEQFKEARNPIAHARPALVTNGHNVGNILRQAGILEIDEGMIVPEGLPRNFDWRSNQIWTKHKALWMPGAILRDPMLRARGH